MIYLILGVALWVAAHLFKRVAPDLRARMGNAGKALVAVGVLAGLGLMIVGYKQAEVVNLWYPPTWTVHLNNLLMLVAVFVYGMSATTGRLRGRTATSRCALPLPTRSRRGSPPSPKY
jgi:uncharacterized membrane protein